MMEWSRVPREMQTGCVCVILRFPPRAFPPSQGKVFHKIAVAFVSLLIVSRQLYLD